MFTYYQDAYCYYFWKPAGIPSTFGKQTSFLDCLLENSSLTRDKFFCKEKISPNSEKGVDNVVQSLFTFFGIERELGLLNRLDNETSGLLYFAKNPRVYQQFKALQATFHINKYYVAEVYGDISKAFPGTPGQSLYCSNYEKSKILQDCETRNISYPIAHHKYNADRMVAILHPSDLQKARGTLHQLTTEILEFEYFSTTKTSILLIRIQKGIRHQIRVHLAALGYPLCGDKLYSKAKHKDYNTLQLFSVGLEII